MDKNRESIDSLFNQTNSIRYEYIDQHIFECHMFSGAYFVVIAHGIYVNKGNGHKYC